MILRTKVLLQGDSNARSEGFRKRTTAKVGWQQIRHFLASEDGPTAVEYAVMLMLVMAVCLSAVKLIGQETQASYSKSANSISNAMSS
jgi:pilus assembly protein Flp/PilA